jgi:hypothetical protein
MVNVEVYATQSERAAGTIFVRTLSLRPNSGIVTLGIAGLTYISHQSKHYPTVYSGATQSLANADGMLDNSTRYGDHVMQDIHAIPAS